MREVNGFVEVCSSQNSDPVIFYFQCSHSFLQKFFNWQGNKTHCWKVQNDENPNGESYIDENNECEEEDETVQDALSPAVDTDSGLGFMYCSIGGTYL